MRKLQILSFTVCIILVLLLTILPEIYKDFDLLFNVGTLFSGLAFLGMIYALMLQRKSLHQQMFESPFFQMLKLYDEVVNSFFISSDQGEFKGRLFFVSEYDSFMKERVVNPTFKFEDYASQLISKEYRLNCPLRNYFSVIHNILKFTDERVQLEQENKNCYIELLKCQISEGELKFIYLGKDDRVYPKMKELIKLMCKYEMHEPNC